MTFRLKIDLERCSGHGICTLLAPASIDLDQWGFPVLRAEPLMAGAEARSARRAVAACPASALQLESVPELQPHR